MTKSTLSFDEIITVIHLIAQKKKSFLKNAIRIKILKYLNVSLWAYIIGILYYRKFLLRLYNTAFSQNWMEHIQLNLKILNSLCNSIVSFIFLPCMV